MHSLGTITVDAGSRAASVTIQRVMETEHESGNVTGENLFNTLQNHWMNYCGKAIIFRTDPEGALRDKGFRLGLAAKSIRLECSGKYWIALNRYQHVWLEEVFTVSQFKKSSTWCTTAHNDFHRNRGLSPWQLEEAAKRRLRVKEESYKAYIEEELSLRKRRREIHQARPWRHWAAGEWCWYWRSGRHRGSRMKDGVFLGTTDRCS